MLRLICYTQSTILGLGGPMRRCELIMLLRGVAAAAALWMVACCGSAHGQTREAGAVGSTDLGARGGPAEGAHPTAKQDDAAGTFEVSVRAGFASDYIYRGVTMTDHKPVVGAGFEAAFGQFYAGGTTASVKLPTHPAAEVTMGGGVRPSLGSVDFDLSWTYYLYPGETPGSPGINYSEALARADTKIGEALRVSGGFAYSPNYSNTGAWSKYTAFGLGIDLPRNVLPHNVTASLSGAVGYSWFGNQSAELGGFPLPAYLNWHAGVTFTRQVFNLDLRYYDTNLSKEDCFVFTGDLGAVPGGRINPVTNPNGLMSRWCSATVVAKFWFALP
jgi:uncharacterized protein (TIGR02001 family)